MDEYILKLVKILSSFLGDPYSVTIETTQLSFGCPRCIETKGERERNKHNLEVNLKRGVFQCWACAQHDDNMHGSIKKLISIYGNDSILKEYKETIKSLKESELYSLNYKANDFNIEFNNVVSEDVNLPSNFQVLTPTSYDRRALEYLFKRNINWDMINEYHIGFTRYDEKQKQLSNRIIIQSLNKYGELDYWTGRDFTSYPRRQKYFNPKVERKDIVFNEDKIDWDTDVTLVEGPFDHLVVPNSIPLLGKVLKTNFRLYQDIVRKANANINVFLDGDALEDAKKIYKTLNHNNLYGRIRVVPIPNGLDPSKTYELWGAKGIITYLKNAYKIQEYFLV